MTSDENLVEITHVVFAPGLATHFAQKVPFFEGYLTPVTFVFCLGEN